MLGFGKKQIGEVPVPGEGAVTLPAGKVQFRYVEDRKGRSVGTDGGASWAGPGDDLDVTLSPAGGGDPVPIVPRRGVHEGSGFKAIHEDIGTVEVPAAGDYVISSSMTVVEGEHHSPRIVARA